MGKKEVVFLRAKPLPEPRVDKAAKALLRAGYGVRAVGWNREGFREEIQRGYPIHHIGPKGYHGGGLRNLYAMLLWQKDLLLWLWQHRREYTHIHAADLDTVLPAILMKWMAGKRVIYDIYDFFAESRDLPKALLALLHKLELWAVRRSHAVILPDPMRRESLGGVEPKRLAYIYNTPDLRGIPLEEPSAEEELRIAFVGFLGPGRWLLEMVDLVAQHPGWRLDLGGFGPLERELEEKVRSLGNIHFHGRLPYEEVLKLEAKSHVLFAIYHPSLPGHRHSSPNKLFEAMALGKPILVAKGTGMDQMVEKEGLGFVVDYGRRETVEEALSKVAQMGKEERQAFARRVEGMFQAGYSWEAMERILKEVYEEA